MAVKARERYRVDLIGLQAACEANYARLMRLLPDMRHTPEARRIAVTHGDQRHAAVIFLGKDRLSECIAAVGARQKEHLVYRCKAGAFYVPQKAFPKAVRQTRGLQQQQSREQK